MTFSSVRIGLPALLTIMIVCGAPSLGDEPEPVLEETVEVFAEPADLEVETLDAESLEAGRAANLALALEAAGGVSGVRRSQNSFEPVLRGLGWERVQTQINGIPLHGACPARMDPPATLVAAEAVDRAAVVKGLASVTLGPAGTGGRLMVSTDHDRGSGSGRELHPWLRSVYDGARDGYRLGGGLSGGTERLDFSAGLETISFDDYDSADGITVPAGQEETGGHLSIGHRPTETSRWSVGAIYQDAEGIDYPSLPMNTDSSETGIYNFAYRYEPANRGGRTPELELRIGLANVDHLMSNRGKPTRMMVEAETESWADTVSAGLASRWVASTHVVLRAGVDFTGLERDALRQRRVVASGAVFRDHLWPDVSQDDLGLFGEVCLLPAPGWHLRLGLRYDDLSSEAAAADDPGMGGNTIRENYVRFYGEGAADTDRDEELFSGNLVVSRSLTPRVDLQAGVGIVSRAAGMTERYFSFAPAPNGFVVGNPTLDAEHKRELSVATTYEGAKIAAGASAYYYAFDDYILSTVLARMDVNGDEVEDVIRGFENVDAELAGIELNALYEPSERWSVPVSVAYVRGRNSTDGQPLPEIPPLEARLAGRRTFTGQFSGWLELGGRFVEGQHRIDESFGEDATGGFAVWHLRGRANVARYLAIEAGIENLLDKEYNEHLAREAAVPVGDLALGDEIPQPGRSFVVQLRFAF